MLDAVFNILKVTVVIFIASTFLVAIMNLITFIQAIVFGNLMGEFFQLISMYLPFNASAVFSGFSLSIAAIGSFLVSKKIFDLTSRSVSSV